MFAVISAQREMADLKYSPEALKDLDEIWDYIYSDLCNPDAADHTVDAILVKTESLREFPFSGAPLDTISRIHSDYRFVPANNFLAFYRVQDGVVYIDRILYGRRDCLRTLLGLK
ncbi:MAG: type II toxin-antitoxin system RelE/ParE family toxin [Clostridia bacterium]|nr:type II toxin-antitoxin system RelE/ParE family toxin [Clostridiales bacterium]MBQ6717052.1 type II toxin-antitoxin system RelE/ParE family toxin [Clostridia bacterium]